MARFNQRSPKRAQLIYDNVATDLTVGLRSAKFELVSDGRGSHLERFMRSTLPMWVFVLVKTPLRAPAAGCSPVWPACMAAHTWQVIIFMLSSCGSADTRTLALIL